MMIRNIFIIPIAFIIISVLTAQSSALLLSRSQRSVADCGKSKILQPLIMKGKKITRGTFPWIVALNYLESTPPEFFCAGTLITKSFVISAAHCIHGKHETEKLKPSDILAFFGAHNLSNPEETGRFELSPIEIFLHPDWNTSANNYDGDLALLEFEAGKINFNDFVQPICFWNSENKPNSTQGTVVGWGWSGNLGKDHENIPKMINASIQKNADCWLKEHRLLGLSSRRTFCAGSENGSGVCIGDSGGGFFIKIGGVYYLKGIVSTSLTGDIGCDVSVKAVYSNVPKYKKWIKSIVPLVPVFCFYEQRESYPLKRRVKHCEIKENIDSEGFFLEPPIDTNCEVFYIRDNKDVKHLPRQISKILPNLQEINVQSCGLMIIRDFYFKNMRKLRFLALSNNKIVTIEPNAFEDLVSLEYLWLRNNFIQTLDEKLFVSMIKLEEIYLTSNKIKFLSPATFKIPGGKLGIVDLVDNICIHQAYTTAEQLNRIESDLRAQCSSNAKALSPRDLKNVVCTYYQENLIWRCHADQKIESEDYFVLKEPIRDDVEIFHMFHNKYVKFLPKNIGEKFPNLWEFDVQHCGLTIVRDFYFKNMRKSKHLILSHNKIATIEPEAFKDLVKVERLLLQGNLIETLDENIFASMISVKEIYLNNNKIKLLSQTTFKIPGGRLFSVDLQVNICIDQKYWLYQGFYNFNKLECDLEYDCSKTLHIFGKFLRPFC